MLIKICANTNLEDARLAAELGVDAVGFVFAPSKRQVTAEQVAAITRGAAGGAGEGGGVYVDGCGEILQAAKVAGLTAVQLHSAFDRSWWTRSMREAAAVLHVVQVVDVPAGMDLEELRRELTAVLSHPYVLAALLDASHGGASGGTGKSFDWERTAAVVREVQEATGGRVIVAGGLTCGECWRGD